MLSAFSTPHPPHATTLLPPLAHCHTLVLSETYPHFVTPFPLCPIVIAYHSQRPTLIPRPSLDPIVILPPLSETRPHPATLFSPLCVIVIPSLSRRPTLVPRHRFSYPVAATLLVADGSDVTRCERKTQARKMSIFRLFKVTFERDGRFVIKSDDFVYEAVEGTS